MLNNSSSHVNWARCCHNSNLYSTLPLNKTINTQISLKHSVENKLLFPSIHPQLQSLFWNYCLFCRWWSCGQMSFRAPRSPPPTKFLCVCVMITTSDAWVMSGKDALLYVNATHGTAESGALSARNALHLRYSRGLSFNSRCVYLLDSASLGQNTKSVVINKRSIYHRCR